jgi:hypothetical protein
MAKNQSDELKDVAIRKDPNAPSAQIPPKKQSLSGIFTIVSAFSAAT